MTKEEAKSFITDISYKLGNMAVEYLTEKDGEKMREAIQALEQEPNLEKIKRKLQDKIEIHVCEVEENTLIALGMCKALRMMEEVLEDIEKGGE